MLDRAIALGPRQIDIGERDIVLEINEAFLRAGNGHHFEYRLRICSTADGRYILTRCCRNKGLRMFVPIKRTACLHMQMHGRGETTRYREQISIPAYRFVIDQRGYAFQTMPRPFCRKRHGAVVNTKAAARAGGRWPCIDDRNNVRACVFQRLRCFIGIVIVGGDGDAFAGDHAKALHISPNRLRQHYARAVIMGKGHRALDAAGGKNDVACADMPQTLRNTVPGYLPGLGYTLRQRDQIMLPIARCRRAREDAATCGADPFGGRLDPCCILFLRVAEQRWRKNAVLLHKDDALATLCCLDRRLHACGSGADYQQVAKGGTLAKAVGVCLRRRIAQPRCFADEIFIKHPLFGRTKKGFIVKSGGQGWRG